ncbi:MAG: hypothetical protein K6G54_08275 [Oscillospiraceae bacterium]|nr:hypothetical protein [Oscillospiraceae bacterium]
MFTLDEHRTALAKSALAQLCAAALCAIFGAVYERFSHEVYSYYMIYAFAIPLIPGALAQLALALHAKALPGRVSLWLWNAGIATLSVGCLLRGALDIYGTTNRLLCVYPIVGGVLLAAGLLLYRLFSRKPQASGVSALPDRALDGALRTPYN